MDEIDELAKKIKELKRQKKDLEKKLDERGGCKK